MKSKLLQRLRPQTETKVAMARGVIYVDENLLGLAKKLEENQYGFKPRTVPRKVDDRLIIMPIIKGQKFVTANGKDFNAWEDIKKYKYCLIDMTAMEGKDISEQADRIVEVWIERELSNKTTCVVKISREGEEMLLPPPVTPPQKGPKVQPDLIKPRGNK